MRWLLILSFLPLLIGGLLLWRALDDPDTRKSSSEIFLQAAAESGRDPFTESTATDSPASPSPTAEESSASPSPPEASSPSEERVLSKEDRLFVAGLVAQDEQDRDSDDVFLMVTGAVSALGGGLSGVAAVIAVRRPPEGN